jgi:hypothetical protein
MRLHLPEAELMQMVLSVGTNGLKYQVLPVEQLVLPMHQQPRFDYQ